MAIANEQLKQIYQDLQARFNNDRYISIIPLGDEYSEKYEIKYNIHGVVLEVNGNIEESTEHSILISIPFGFPHFPPSCRPQTSTFHPDFDQAAICIGDFWNKDKTLAELIIHIGRMISGEIHSTENTFNDTAASWYKKNSDKLPFERLSFGPTSGQSEDDTPPIDTVRISRNIDTLDESDFSTFPDYLSAEKEQEEEDIAFPPTEHSSETGPLEQVLLLIRLKKYYELSSLLASLDPEEQFEDREEIEKNVEEILNRARKLQKEADELEHQGDSTEALQLLEKIEDIAPDFPNIEENISRTRKTCQLADDWAPENGQQPGIEPQGKNDSNGGKQKQRIAFFDVPKKASLKIIPVLTLVILVGLIATIIIPFFSVNSQLKKAELALSQCTALLDKNVFKQALQNCQSARSLLDEVYFFKKKQQAALSTKIKQTITSEKMQQGLDGKILFHGKYVYKKDKEIVLAFEKARGEGDTFFKEESWAGASEKYLSALEIAKPSKDSFDEETLEAVLKNYALAQINVLLNKGRWFLAAGDFEKSEDSYKKARTFSEQLPIELQDPYISELDSKSSELEYLKLLDLGKKFFVSNDWESAIEQYKKALKLHNQTSLAARQQDVDSLYTNMAEAELYSLISNGKEAFAKSQWNRAIRRYTDAIELLNNKIELLERINPAFVQQQLQRIILRVRIVQNKQDADSKLDQHLYKDAIEIFDRVTELITESGYMDDHEFKSIYSGTKNSIAEARLKAAKADKITYLISNYKDIFQENYAAAVPQYLKDPKATFIKNIGRKQLFELQCLESGQGRKVRLVMQYIYDPDTGRWQFYSENN